MTFLTTAPVLFFASLLSVDPQDTEIRALLAKVKQNETRLETELEKFGYTERVDSLDNGKRKVEDFEVTNFKGRRIRRLVARDGKPLTGSDLEKENKRIEKLILKMEKGEVPPLTNRRLRLEDLVAAAQFSNVHSEQIQGRTVTAFDFGPRANYKPANMNERFILNLKGQLWVDPVALQVVRADFGLTGPFKIAGGLFFSMKPGTRFYNDQQWYDNRIWLPKSTRVLFTAKAMMAKSLNLEINNTYSEYRRFDVSATATQ